MSDPITSSVPCSSTSAAASGDPSKWFQDEIHVHEGQLKAYLRGSFPSVRDVDDVVQESYIKIWRARAKEPILSAKAFLYMVARRVALDLIRHEKRSPIDQVKDLSALGVLVDGPTASESAILQERIELLGSAIAALATRRREIVILRKFRRLSQKEVAEQLGVSEHTVENQLHRGVRQIQAYLADRGVSSFYGNDSR